jgi:hypothetical protein
VANGSGGLGKYNTTKGRNAPFLIGFGRTADFLACRLLLEQGADPSIAKY